MFLTFIIALTAAILICGLVFLHAFPALSNHAQVFTDIIIETLAKTGLNKSAELSLFRHLCILGIIIFLAVVLAGRFVMRRKAAGVDADMDMPKNTGAGLPPYTGILIMPLLLNCLVFGSLNKVLAAGLLYFILLLLTHKKLQIRVSEGLLVPVLVYYALLAFLTVCFHVTDRFAINSMQLYIATGIITLLLLMFSMLTGKHPKSPDGMPNIILKRSMLILQCFIPFLLVLYFVDTYAYRGQLIRVPYAPFYYVFFGSLLLFLTVFSALHVWKNWRKAPAAAISKIVSVSTVISVFIYNSFSAAPMYAQPDQHHHGEQMIPWQQIVSLGQSAYEEYTPVSGLFPMVSGFIQNVLLGGTVSDYSPAISMTMVLFCMVTIVLIYKHTGGGYALLFAVFFALPSYNRQYMVLPVLLLLFLPNLLEKPSVWIKVWIFSCLLTGLYYPLYGAAVIAGTLPLGIHMIIRMGREIHLHSENGLNEKKRLRTKNNLRKETRFSFSKESDLNGDTRLSQEKDLSSENDLSKEARLRRENNLSGKKRLSGENNLSQNTDSKAARQKTWVLTGWAICLLPILLCFPLLVRMFKHTLTYSGQTILADGIALTGQTPPDYFMPYLTGVREHLRGRLYLGYRFFLPMLGIWLFAVLLFLLLQKAFSERKKAFSERKKVTFMLPYVMFAGIGTLAVSYSYTLVRADYNMILSRTAPILTAVCGMFLPAMFLSHHRSGKHTTDRRILIFVLGICFSLPLMIYHKVSDMKFPDMWIYPNGDAALIMDDTSKLYSHYEVPESFVKMDEINLPDTSMLGDGFMVADQIGYLQQYETVMQKCNAALRGHALSDTLPQLSYMGFDGQGFYYYVNARACSTGFIQAGKGYDAQQEILAQAEQKRPVIFLMEPQSTYYVYYWMMTNDYVYVKEDDAFYPMELYCLVYEENYTTQTLSADGSGSSVSSLATGALLGDDYRDVCPATDFGRVCASFGASYESLTPLFTDSMSVDSLLPDDSVNGMLYDMLYLEFFKNQTKVQGEIQDGVQAKTADESRVDENITGESITDEGRAGENTTDESSAGENGTDENRADENITGESSAGENTTGESKTDENSLPLLPEAAYLKITFTCDGKSYDGASVTCQLVGERLLIPLGMNADWLLSDNSDICCSILDADGNVLSQQSLQEFADKYLQKGTFLKLSQSR